jgi:hypothetical protein
MKVRCKKKSGYYQFVVIPYDFESDHEDIASLEGATSDTGELEYDLTLENDYNTYGIVVLDGDIRYLLQDDHGDPGLFPSSLFEVLQSGIPLGWEIAEYHLREKTMLVIGYSDLVNQYSHLRGIILLQPDDIKIFLENKRKTMTIGL